VVQQDDGQYYVLKDDDTLLRTPGSRVQTQNFSDGSTLTEVLRDDGTKIVTIRDASGRVLRRARIERDGTETVLINDLASFERIDRNALPAPQPELSIRTSDNGASLRAALAAIEARDSARAYSLRQIRDYREVRALAPSIDVRNITFATGASAIAPDQAEKLADLGDLLSRMVDEDQSVVFLVEGHTDAIGLPATNLALSDRRAESVALALTEYFGVPPENLVVQGYGESDLLIPTDAAEPLNRRVAVRLVSPLMRRLELR
jgi:outer membrane protein OmpA-like peptidoglycan-associated protein